MNTKSAIAPAAANPLFELQQALYASSNYTRRRLHQDRLRWVSTAIAVHAAGISPCKALEYGPGSGIYLPILSRHCGQVIAADVEDAYLSAIRPLVAELDGLQLLVDDVQDSRFEANSFGLVLCTEVLEHVPDPERSLHTLHRILKPGGIAIVTTPQRFSLMELSCKVGLLPGLIQLARLVYKEPVLETGHISLRTARAFRAGIAAAGFDVVQQKKFGLYVPLLAEFAGSWGGHAIESLERRLAASSADWLLWTQAYVLRKPLA
jgi:2-polyprenyl-3-methyl-5-hydroxy-6-metoxy-1,4-benzoquinol methylase